MWRLLWMIRRFIYLWRIKANDFNRYFFRTIFLQKFLSIRNHFSPVSIIFLLLLSLFLCCGFSSLFFFLLFTEQTLFKFALLQDLHHDLIHTSLLLHFLFARSSSSFRSSDLFLCAMSEFLLLVRPTFWSNIFWNRLHFDLLWSQKHQRSICRILSNTVNLTNNFANKVFCVKSVFLCFWCLWRFYLFVFFLLNFLLCFCLTRFFQQLCSLSKRVFLVKNCMAEFAYEVIIWQKLSSKIRNERKFENVIHTWTVIWFRIEQTSKEIANILRIFWSWIFVICFYNSQSKFVNWSSIKRRFETTHFVKQNPEWPNIALKTIWSVFNNFRGEIIRCPYNCHSIFFCTTKDSGYSKIS